MPIKTYKLSIAKQLWQYFTLCKTAANDKIKEIDKHPQYISRYLSMTQAGHPQYVSRGLCTIET